VSVGLADIIHKCLASEPRDRYARAADLAADLRRHLADRPLRGVRNRSLAERWAKWRRRTPYALRLLLLGLAVLLTSAAVLMFALGHLADRSQPRALLERGERYLTAGDYDRAIAELRHGLALAEGLP